MSAILCPENLQGRALKSLPGALRSLPGALDIAAWSALVSFCQQTRQFLGHQVDFSGHTLAGFRAHLLTELVCQGGGSLRKLDDKILVQKLRH